MTLKRSTRPYWNRAHNSTSVLLNLAPYVFMPGVHNRTNVATRYLPVERCTPDTHAWGCFSAPAPLCWVFGSGAWRKEKTLLVHFLHKDCRGNYFNISTVLDGSADEQELSVVKRVVLIYTYFLVFVQRLLAASLSASSRRKFPHSTPAQTFSSWLICLGAPPTTTPKKSPRGSTISFAPSNVSTRCQVYVWMWSVPD